MKSLKVENYQKNQSISSWNPGEIQQRSSMPRILTDEFHYVVKRKIDTFQAPIKYIIEFLIEL